MEYESMVDYVDFWNKVYIFHMYHKLLKKFIKALEDGQPITKNVFNRREAEYLLYIIQEHKYDLFGLAARIDDDEVFTEEHFYMLEGALKVYLET